MAPDTYLAHVKTSLPGELVGTYVVVRYDKKLYPGIVIDDDTDEVQVKCMHQIGDNRFFWPTRDDICYYNNDDVLAIIPEPVSVTSRHKCIYQEMWNNFVQEQATYVCQIYSKLAYI